MVTTMSIAGRDIGPGHPCFVIAEAGVNHNGKIEIAHQLIDAAVAARADAVKFQTFDAAKLATPNAPKAAYQKQRTDADDPAQFEMLRRLQLSMDDFAALKAHCDDAGILFLSTPFDADSADGLSTLGMAAIKVPSGEVTNHPFIAYLARKGVPMILSTGMADMDEVRAAVDAAHGAGAMSLALLHCISAYPAPPAYTNLRAMDTLADAFGIPVGLSDHSEGLMVPIAAAARGANIIEKHFTLDRGRPGPDHAASLEPGELAAMVAAIHDTEAALGDGKKIPSMVEMDVRDIVRRSLIPTRNLAAGETVGSDDLIALRPGTGISPADIDRVVGRRVVAPIVAGTVLTWEMLEPS